MNIKEVMQKAGVSIEALKDRIEKKGNSLSRTSISNIINGKSVPRIDTLETIAKALEVPLNMLFDNTTETIHLIIKDELKTFQSLKELKNYVSSL